MAVNINVPSQVKTYANLAAFPASGALKTIYIAEDTNKTYRWTGSVYVEVSAAGATGITIGTTAIASGTVGRVLFEGTGNVVSESGNLTWDDTNKRLNLNFVTGATNYRMNFRAPELGTRLNGVHFTDGTDTSSYGYIALSGSSGEMRLFTGGSYFPTFYSNGAERMRIFTTGNVLINTTTDAGYKLDVNGTARVSGQLSSGASGTNGNIGLRRTSDGSIVGSFYTDAAQTIVKEHTGTGGVLLNGFDTTSLKWVGTSSQPRVGIGFNGTINATCHIKGAFATSATSSLLIENSAGTAAMRVRDDLVIILPNLPTSSAGLPTSAIWNDAGTLKIV